MGGGTISIIIAIIIAIISSMNKKQKQAQNQPRKPMETPWDDMLNWDIKPQKLADTYIPQVKQTIYPACLETIEKDTHSLETMNNLHKSSMVNDPKQKKQVGHKMTSPAIKEEEISNEHSERDAIFEGGFNPRMGIIYAEILNPKYKEF